MLGKHTLEPNEKTDLKVTFETEGRPGSFQKTVTFSTNIPGQEKIEVFSMKGMVKEAPAAKIVVQPRRIVLNEAELNAGKEQTLPISNQGSIPLIITRIRSKDGNTVYFDGEKEGNIVIESNQTNSFYIGQMHVQIH